MHSLSVSIRSIFALRGYPFCWLFVPASCPVPVMPRRTPAQEMQEARKPLPSLADNDPDTVFAVVALFSLEEMWHLAGVFGHHLPALIQRAAAAEQALALDHLWPDQFFGDGDERAAFQGLLDHLGPVRAAGGLHPSVQFQQLPTSPPVRDIASPVW